MAFPLIDYIMTFIVIILENLEESRKWTKHFNDVYTMSCIAIYRTKSYYHREHLHVQFMKWNRQSLEQINNANISFDKNAFCQNNPEIINIIETILEHISIKNDNSTCVVTVLWLSVNTKHIHVRLPFLFTFRPFDHTSFNPNKYHESTLTRNPCT